MNDSLQKRLVFLMDKLFKAGHLDAEDRARVRMLQRALGIVVVNFVPTLIPDDIQRFQIAGVSNA